ncbi:MAG: CinA family nicotinamide mononucleotide deamidase-related protein [Candidatus Hydrogenedentes bacterium]|nr:CinA family nicotinamide mononucleotide deamidase-related protein [Candidatus Hydrogenedentota bacterium]
MHAELLMIGTELLLGQIVDSNAAFMARTLAENGIDVYRKTTVGDNPERIRQALDDVLNRADVVVISGGLGPTEDDITRECIAELLGRPLEFRPELFQQLEARFARLGVRMTDNNRKQALAPQGAIGIENPNGTAPGLIIEDARGVIVCMPGVPKELYPMLADQVIPYLRKKFNVTDILHWRVLKVCGMGESRIDAAIGDLIVSQRNPTVGLLASPEAVRIRITAKAENLDEANRLIDAVEAKVRERLPGRIMGVDDDTIETVLDRLLAQRGWTLAVAETFTGGIIGQRLTASGAKQFAGGLTFPAAIYSGDGAMAAALELAQKTRTIITADCFLCVVADPETNRGFAFLFAPDDAVHWDVSYMGRDERSQLRAAIQTLEQVRRYLMQTGESGLPPTQI